MNKFALLIILIITLVQGCKESTVPNPASPYYLAKGINLSNWFNDYSDPSQYSNRFSTATLQLIKTKGFTYVRITCRGNNTFQSVTTSATKFN
jgi:endoglucanase